MRSKCAGDPLLRALGTTIDDIVPNSSSVITQDTDQPDSCPKRRRIRTKIGPTHDQFWLYDIRPHDEIWNPLGDIVCHGSRKRLGSASAEMNSFINPQPTRPHGGLVDLPVQGEKRKCPSLELQTPKTGRSNVRLQPDDQWPSSVMPWETPRGHHIQSSGDIFWCVKCGAYTSSTNGRSQYLRKVNCRGPVTSRLVANRESLLSGRHPLTGLPLKELSTRVQGWSNSN